MFSKFNMRIINLGAMLLVTIAWLARFMYFVKREEMIEREVETINPETRETTTTT